MTIAQDSCDGRKRVKHFIHKMVPITLPYDASHPIFK